MLSPKTLRELVAQEHDYSHVILYCCDADLEIRTLQSNAGWYIGTACDNCGPVSRLSAEYYNSMEEAQTALTEGKFNLKTWL